MELDSKQILQIVDSLSIHQKQSAADHTQVL